MGGVEVRLLAGGTAATGLGADDELLGLDRVVVAGEVDKERALDVVCVAIDEVVTCAGPG